MSPETPEVQANSQRLLETYSTMNMAAPATLDLEPNAAEEALRKRLFAPVTSSSRAKRMAQAILGPTGRVWDRDGVKQVGLQHVEGGQTVFGQGATWADAFVAATKDLTPDEIRARALSELKAVHSADLRAMFQRNR